jgi:hypothetical protein
MNYSLNTFVKFREARSGIEEMILTIVKCFSKYGYKRVYLKRISLLN